MRKVALVPSSFNPPTIEDLRVVSALLASVSTNERKAVWFDEVVLSLLSDGSAQGEPEPSWEDRFKLLQLMFPRQNRLSISAAFAHATMATAADDLYQAYTRTGADVTFVVPYEDITPGEDGQCVIERTWQNGTVLLARASFCVARLHGAPCLERELPPRSFYLPRTAERSLNHALVVRRLCREHAPLKGHLPPAVAEAIVAARLYGRHPVFAD